MELEISEVMNSFQMNSSMKLGWGTGDGEAGGGVVAGREHWLKRTGCEVTDLEKNVPAHRGCMDSFQLYESRIRFAA